MFGGQMLPLPRGVRFYASDEDLIDDFLRPRVQGFFDPLDIIDTINVYDSEPYALLLQHVEFYPPMNWWYFIPRLHLRRGRPNREISNVVHNGGFWRYAGKSKIKRGGHVIGFKERVEFCTPVGVRTGWCMFEYTLAVPDNAFQTLGLVHIFYDVSKDDVAAAGAGAAAVGAVVADGVAAAAVGAAVAGAAAGVDQNLGIEDFEVIGVDQNIDFIGGAEDDFFGNLFAGDDD